MYERMELCYVRTLAINTFQNYDESHCCKVNLTKQTIICPKMARIQNVVSTVELAAKIDLLNLARNTINIEYNPTKFIAAIMRLRQPRKTCLCFDSGRLVIVNLLVEYNLW